MEEGGDIWRLQSGQSAGVQPSGPVDGSYEYQIPFRQQEFINAFLEWILMDNIKIRKAVSQRLRRAFKIANGQACKAIPKSDHTINAWITEMFLSFEPHLIEEIKNARSRIHITFDGWGSKHEKLSVLGVVVHFINAQGKAVTRLLGLPELPGHGKKGTGKWHFVPSPAFLLSSLLLQRITSLPGRDALLVVLLFYKCGLVCRRRRGALANKRVAFKP